MLPAVCKNWRFWLLGVLVAVYIASLFLLSFGVKKENSPDEHAARIFTTLVADGHLPRIKSYIGEEYGEIIHPRSMLKVGGWIVPISFLGLPFWYGVAGLILGGWAPGILLTPLLVALALVSWFWMMKALFISKRLAGVATFLLATQPAFWYYAARTYMHNVPFICLVIIAAGILFIPSKLSSYLKLFIAGLVFGIAISFRWFEMPWLAFLLVVTAWNKKAKWNWRHWGLFGLGFAFSIAPILFLQNILYQAPLGTGYTVNAVVAADSGSVIAPFKTVLSYIFPFGFHPRSILRTVWQNVWLLSPWFSGLVILGLSWLAINRKEWRMAYKTLFVSLAGVAIWNFALYGSWRINDNPDPLAITLANSYSRYWLPIYVLAIPFAVLGAQALWNALYAFKYRRLIFALGALVYVASSAVLVMSGPDGLWQTRQRLFVFEEDAAMLQQSLRQHEGAIVIAGYADKYLFGDVTELMVTSLTDGHTLKYLPEILAQKQVYYFGITLPADHIAYYESNNAHDAAGNQYKMVPIMTLRDQTLYHFERSYE